MGNRAAIAATQVPPAGALPLLVSVAEAARLCGVGRSHFYVMVASGLVGPRPIKLGARVLFNRDDLRAWVGAGCPARHEWTDADAPRERRI